MPRPLKSLFLLLLLVAGTFSVKSQPAPRPVNTGSLAANQTVNEKTGLLYRDWAANAREAGANLGAGEGVTGTWFFNEGWRKGFLLFNGSKKVNNITLSFNAATNEIYIWKDSQALVLDGSLPVTEFGLYNPDDSTRIDASFRCGFPAAGSGTAKTFYQVLASGKISFLKLTGKKLLQINNSAGIPVKNILTTGSWYIYDSTANTLLKIRLNKNSLTGFLPGREKDIQSVVDEKKLKLKSEADWTVLINELNSKQ
ncbi:hypothetical protein ACX0G9_03990 [Flavitalea flava]